MADNTPDTNSRKGPLRRFLDLPADSVPKTLFVAVTLCLFASMIVSVAAVSLRPIQEENKLRDKRINILQVAGVYMPGENIREAFQAFEPHVLDLTTGKFTDEFDVATFDERAAADDPELSRDLSSDPAGIGRQSNFKTIYLLRKEDGSIDKVILPVH